MSLQSVLMLLSQERDLRVNRIRPVVLPERPHETGKVSTTVTVTVTVRTDALTQL